MKIRHIAVVAAAMVAGVAFAQSNVSLYGIVDTGIRFDNNADGKGRNATYLNNGTLSNSRFGFMGKEDLGSGLKAGFQIEAGFALNNGRQDGIALRVNKNNNLDTQGRIFNRIAKVGIESEYGSLYFGRQYTLMFDTVSLYEPTDWYNAETYYSGNQIISAGQLVSERRSDNTVYYAGAFGPVTLRASYAFGGVPGSMQSGSSWAGGLSYEDSMMGGVLKLGTAFDRSISNRIQGGITMVNFPNSGTATYNTDTATVGGSYAYGPIRGMVGYIYKKTDGQTLVAGGTGAYNQNTIFGGLVYSVTPAIDLSLAYYRHKLNAKGTVGDGYNFASSLTTANVDGKADVIVFIADYKLSKRTDIYATYDYTRTGTADGLQSMYMPFSLASDPNVTANAKNSRSGYTVGVRHRF